MKDAGEAGDGVRYSMIDSDHPVPQWKNKPERASPSYVSIGEVAFEIECR